MSLPSPEPGLVVRYGYVWSQESRRGRTEAMKDRPCAIVLAAGGGEVVVVPITHSPPRRPEAAIQLSSGVSRSLGLDDEQSWVVVDETNQFQWPGSDLRPTKGGEWIYGRLPRGELRRIARAVAEHMRAGRFKPVIRPSE